MPVALTRANPRFPWRPGYWRVGSGDCGRVRAASHWARAEFAPPLARDARMGHTEAATVDVKTWEGGVNRPVEAPSIAVRAHRGVAKEDRRKATMRNQ